MSRGQDERSQVHAMSVLLNTCSGMTNRVLIDDGTRWILQGDEQERENRTAGVEALCWRRLGRIRERFGKTAGVAKLSDVFQFQWTSPDSLENKCLRWQKLMRQVNMTSLGDDARETLTIAGLEKAKERALEQHLRLRAPQTWAVLCAGVDQFLRTRNWCRDVYVCLLWQSWTRESEVSIPQCEVQQLWQDRTSQSDVQTTREICWQVKSVEQWPEFCQRRHEPWKHRQVLLLWSSTTSLPSSKRELQPLWQAWSFELCVLIFWWERKCSGC